MPHPRTPPQEVATRAVAHAQDPLWYKDAVIYELHVKAFFDSNNDGIGDFPGLIGKLDYLQELGVTALWLLPFYPSPLKDDGYDIADYHNVHADYGTRADFRHFVREAHRRGLRVITELVINHTSDQHPWFQAARRAPPGSPKREYYVWSESNQRYAGTRVIFTDSERSNWTWDDAAGAYYWHRFFAHQPDLNFDNPRVLKALVRAMRFWLDLGVDGLRLDAIPYLCEREGTNNENLPETHAVVRRIRAIIDAHYADRMLLAEANQWPEDVRDYFGEADECHMAFHFPLMPRMYMAIAQEDRHPIVEILQQTPDIPERCQWAIFLRNHDELTLEMVTSRERDYMYQMYASDPRARLNLGIRRRLAPLMDNDMDRIRLMNALLLSMPGSPIIYYGDEIGMGDNIYLGDRNGVRTPMQWSLDRNAGFSQADPQRLFAPPIMDPVYGYQAVNVEAQSRDPSSLLNWMRRVLAVRDAHKAFGRGSLEFLRPGNRKILAFVRQYGDEILLCVANLARAAQPVELELARWKGRVPVELLGRAAFPPIGDLPYLLTLQGHGFYWFQLKAGEEVPGRHEERLLREELPVLVLFDGWHSLFRDRVLPWRIAMADKVRAQLENDALPRFVAAQRWHAEAHAAVPRRVTLADHAQWTAERDSWLVALFRSDDASIFLPLALAWEDDEDRLRAMQPAAIARVRQQAQVGVLADALADERFCRALVLAVRAGSTLRCEHGTIAFSPAPAIEMLDEATLAALPVSPPAIHGVNSSVTLGDRVFLKCYRRLVSGINPEVEVGRFLVEAAHFARCVPVLGTVEYRGDDGATSTLALVQAGVDHQGDAWGYTLEYLARVFEQWRVATPPRPPAAAIHGGYLGLMRTLGQRTAELHRALATPAGDPDFAPEAISAGDLAAWADAARERIVATLAILEQRRGSLAEAVQADATALLAAREAVLRRIEITPAGGAHGLKIRCHGDFHLARALLVQNDFFIIGFGGDPHDGRKKHSPLRDVVGMLRSFDWAARMARARATAERADELAAIETLAHEWRQQAARAFVHAYRDQVLASGAQLYGGWDEARRLLDLFLLDHAFGELRNELAEHPERTFIPLRAILAPGIDV